MATWIAFKENKKGYKDHERIFFWRRARAGCFAQTAYAFVFGNMAKGK
jgi:hypothetical protein